MTFMIGTNSAVIASARLTVTKLVLSLWFLMINCCGLTELVRVGVDEEAEVLFTFGCPSSIKCYEIPTH